MSWVEYFKKNIISWDIYTCISTQLRQWEISWSLSYFSERFWVHYHCDCLCRYPMPPAYPILLSTQYLPVCCLLCLSLGFFVKKLSPPATGWGRCQMQVHMCTCTQKENKASLSSLTGFRPCTALRYSSPWIFTLNFGGLNSSFGDAVSFLSGMENFSKCSLEKKKNIKSKKWSIYIVNLY